MFKQTLAALAIIAVSATAMTGTAEAGSKKHFKFHNKFFKHHYVHAPKFHGGGCYRFKKKAIILKKRGYYGKSKYYFKKYKICKIRSSY